MYDLCPRTQWYQRIYCAVLCNQRGRCFVEITAEDILSSPKGLQRLWGLPSLLFMSNGGTIPGSRVTGALR
jgi:hypothetical protein